MADPNLELDPNTLPGGAYPAPDTSVTDPSRVDTLLSPGETGPQSKPLSATAAGAIQGQTPRAAVSTADKTAIAHLADPYREAPAARVKPPPQTGLNRAIDHRPRGLPPQAVAAKRDHRDLGRPPPDTVQDPHPSEVPNIFHSIGQWFGQTNIGSATTQMLGGQMAKETDAYIFAKQKSQMNEQTIRYNNMRNRGLDVQTQLETELMDYARAMGGDPKTLTQRLLAVARQHGDTNLPFIVTHQGAQAGLDYLTKLDRRFQDMHKGNAALKGVEEEQNTEGGLANPPDHPSKTKPSDSTAAGDGGGDGGGGNPYRTGAPVVVAPITGADTGTGAPTQKPPTAPDQAAPQPLGPTVVVPGADNAAPDQGGFRPSIQDTGPQGAAGPLPGGQGVQVAEAGASDLPPTWVNQLADISSTPTGEAAAAVTAQQDNYDLQEPESEVLRNPRFAKGGGPIRATDQINRAAQQAIKNPSVIDELKKTGQPNLARLAEGRSLEISDYLTSIANDPHPAGPWVVRDINRAVPGLGNTVQQIANGSAPPPTARQQYGRDPYPRLIQMLVGKVDPSMLSPQAYEGRYKNLMAYGPGGVQGKAVMSNITAFQHIDGNVAILKELQSIPGWKDYLGRTAQSLPGESVLGPLLRIPATAGAAALGGEQGQRVQQLLNQYQINLDIAIAEGQRAASGAAPHEAGMDRLLAAMDITKNTESGAMAAAQQLTEMLSRRLQVQADTFVASTGTKTKDGLLNYIAKYLPGGGYQTLTGQTVGPQLLTPEIRQFLGGQGSAATPQSIDDIMRKYGG